MKKAIWGGIIVVLVAVLGGYALWSASRSEPAVVPDNQTGQTSTSTSPTASGTDNGVGDSSSPSDVNPGQYKDGTYTGSVGSAAPYGNVQVKVTITGGKLTAISLLQAPKGPGNTDALTASSFPIMIKEAIAKQSSNVDIISGATQNTEGFNTSLTSALQQAQS
ncbi:FMN-binding protein [Patescibacteria group bacterium]|nr:FMN-binding protein [Patescibacteria group bacterium]